MHWCAATTPWDACTEDTWIWTKWEYWLWFEDVSESCDMFSVHISYLASLRFHFCSCSWSQRWLSLLGCRGLFGLKLSVINISYFSWEGQVLPIFHHLKQCWCHLLEVVLYGNFFKVVELSYNEAREFEIFSAVKHFAFRHRISNAAGIQVEDEKALI